jgi:2-polyprenyl-3-methyl-5-hydroxy-6-metoxy-1,4-benzoquinol methylase
MDKSLPEKCENRLQEARQYWDHQASSFDDAPDHGLHDPVILAAWTTFLKTYLPSSCAAILDIGCGTGSLSAVLASLGHQVTGMDLSPAMLTHAKAKAATKGLRIEYLVGDATYPGIAPRQFDIILCRHLLWALPEPQDVLSRWAWLLKSKGRMILVEGYWGTGSGLHANDILHMLPPVLTNAKSIDLTGNPDLWGGQVEDERFALIADHL